VTADPPILNQLNLAVRDMDATVAFYRRLGLAIDAAPGAPHVGVTLPNGLLLELDTVDFVRRWDAGASGRTGGSAVLGFSLPTRDAVDEVHRSLVDAGYRDHQPPYDAFWGARYAIVEDPDGNGVGLMSPIEEHRKFWPPGTPPSPAPPSPV
jgi:catechol 2,3-dioxygenase-like lactoylglutathione lyase family enzyme